MSAPVKHASGGGVCPARRGKIYPQPEPLLKFVGGILRFLIESGPPFGRAWSVNQCFFYSPLVQGAHVTKILLIYWLLLSISICHSCRVQNAHSWIVSHHAGMEIQIVTCLQLPITVILQKMLAQCLVLRYVNQTRAWYIALIYGTIWKSERIREDL